MAPQRPGAYDPRPLVKPKTQVEIQKEKMVGTSSNNPHYFRLPYKRGQVGHGGEKKETKDDSGGNNIANKQQINRPPTAPVIDLMIQQWTYYYYKNRHIYVYIQTMEMDDENGSMGMGRKAICHV